MKKLTIVIICMLALLTSFGQTTEWKFTAPEVSEMKLTSWNQLKGLILELRVYGLWDNGRLVNSFIPSEQGFSETGTLGIPDGYKSLKWHKVVTGNRNMDIYFDAKVEGLRLNTYSPQEDIKWIDIKKVGTLDSNSNFMLLTVDNRNTYRWFEVNRSGYILLQSLRSLN